MTNLPITSPHGGYGWKKQPPDSRDMLLASVPVKYGGQFVDLSGQFPDPCYDQMALGACVSNATAAAVDFARAKQGLVPLSPPARLFIYWYGRQIEGTISQDSGLNVRDGFKVIATKGAPPESDYPYDISKFTAKPSAQADTDAALDEAVKYLAVPPNQVYDTVASGFPVVIGFDVPSDFEGNRIATTGWMPPASWQTKIIGGHCVVVVSTPKTMNGVECVKVRNSWGTGWGDNGHFWMPTSFLMGSHCSDFWMVATMSDPAPQPTPTPVPADADAALWAVLKPWTQTRHSGDNRKAANAVIGWANDKGYS